MYLQTYIIFRPSNNEFPKYRFTSDESIKPVIILPLRWTQISRDSTCTEEKSANNRKKSSNFQLANPNWHFYVMKDFMVV